MSAYEPPTAIYPVFDSLVFQSPNSESITIAEADTRYLARNNIATSNASLTTFAGDITVGNSRLDYTSGTGLAINGTANGESIFANVLNGAGVTKQKFELNPAHTHLYDAIRITDSTQGNYTLLQQNVATLNIDNQIAGSTTNLKTKTGGGVAVTNMALTSTATQFNTDIILQTTQPTNTAGYLGYTLKVNATLSPVLTSGALSNLSSSPFSMSAGVYLVTLSPYVALSAVSGSVTFLSMGLSTANGAFTGGTGEVYVLGTYSIPASSGYFLGEATAVLSVPTVGASYYILINSTFSGPTATVSSNTSIRYTRIA